MKKKLLIRFDQLRTFVLKNIFALHQTPFRFRLIVATCGAFLLLWIYVFLHLPFSYLDPVTAGATTSIHHWVDVLAVFSISVFVALVMGTPKSRGKKRLLLELISFMVIITFLVSSAELITRVAFPTSALSALVDDSAWIRPFLYENSQPNVPQHIGQLFSADNFTPQGVILSLISLADTFRELNWYWIVLPFVDQRYLTPEDKLSLLILNSCFAIGLISLGYSLAVISPIFRAIPIPRMNISRPKILGESKRTPIRLSRWTARLYRLGRYGFVVALAITVIAAIENARTPYLDWQFISGGPPVLPSVVSLAYCNTTETLFAGTNVGIFRLSKSSSTWQNASFGLGEGGVSQLLIDQNNCTLYANVATWSSGGIFLSLDDGMTWLPIGNKLEGSTYNLLLDERSGILYAYTSKGLLLTNDNGVTWQRIDTMSEEGLIALALNNKDGTLYEFKKDQVMYSSDRGRTWDSIGKAFGDVLINQIVSDSRSGAIYARTSAGIFRSEDNAHSWQTLNTTLAKAKTLVLDESTNSLFVSTDNELYVSHDNGSGWQSYTALGKATVYALQKENRSGTIYAGTDAGVFLSRDNGISWQAASQGLTSVLVRALAVDETDGTLYATTGAGVFRSSNRGVNWYAVNAGLTHVFSRVLRLDSRTHALYAGTNGGLYWSMDKGAYWIGTQLTDVSYNGQILDLLLDDRNGMLYAASLDGVYRSSDGGLNWQGPHTPYFFMPYTLALDRQRDILYAGGDHGVFRSNDGGRTWEISTRTVTHTLPPATYTVQPGDNLFRIAIQFGVTVPDLIADNLGLNPNLIYAGQMITITSPGSSLSSSSSSSESPSSSSTQSSYGLFDNYIRALAINEKDNIVYAGAVRWINGNGGVYRSRDGGSHWESISAGLNNASVYALLLDNRTGILFAGTDQGIYRFDNQIEFWQSSSVGLNHTFVWDLVLDSKSSTLYAVTRAGVFRSSDSGRSWSGASSGLSDMFTQAFVWDQQKDVLYAATGFPQGINGIYLSRDGGASWELSRVGLPNTDIRTLSSDENQNVYANDGKTVFRSVDNGTTWSLNPESISLSEYLSLFFPGKNYGIVGRAPGGELVWASHNGGMLWARIATTLNLHQAAVNPSPEGNDIRAILGGTLYRATQGPDYSTAPLGWLAVRALVWKASFQIRTWVSNYSSTIALAIALAIVTFLVVNYINIARPLGIPLWAIFLARGRVETYAKPTFLDTAWSRWEQMISAELLWNGEVTRDDLENIPSLFRNYSMQRYAREYESKQALEMRNGRLRILDGDRLRRWHSSWNTISKQLGTHSGLKPRTWITVDTLASILAETLGLELKEKRGFEAARAYLVDAPALRLNIPPRFSLVFVADPNPGSDTVQMLVDAVDVIRETGYFALVVPLVPSQPKVDVSAGLRQAINRSVHVQDFIVLNQDDILEILSTRDAIQALARCIIAQVDLSVVSPFVVSGPVPEKMFFGREVEVKTLVEGILSSDYAIVGNRKIGKTSLLQRVRTRLEMGGKTKPFLIDCQTTQDAIGFYDLFQSKSGLQLPSATPEGFRSRLEEYVQKKQPVVLLFDEVDALLTDQRMRGEPLSAMWRTMAHAGICHFAFCGSTRFARLLDDPSSVFFNFTQAVPLGYLSQQVARMVLTQPMETLGIAYDDRETLLNAAFDMTSGHPNLVQYLGKGLVNAANKRKERRILMADLEELGNSTDFTDFYLKTVWGEAGPLEKLITLVAPPEDFRISDIERELRKNGCHVSEEDLDAAFKMLQTYSILTKQDRSYQIVPRALYSILHRTQELDRLINFEKRQFLKRGA